MAALKEAANVIAKSNDIYKEKRIQMYGDQLAVIQKFLSVKTSADLAYSTLVCETFLSQPNINVFNYSNNQDIVRVGDIYSVLISLHLTNGQPSVAQKYAAALLNTMGLQKAMEFVAPDVLKSLGFGEASEQEQEESFVEEEIQDY